MAPRKSPPQGPKPDMLMRDAIIGALNREAENADGRPTRMLQLIADRLVDKAGDGDLAAIKEVINRVDGRVMQPIAPAAMSLEDFLDQLGDEEDFHSEDPEDA